MRIAIISDIHGNQEALTAVMRSVDRARVDRVVSLGDVVGYGASPNSCCEIVRSVAEITLLGNHDAAVAERMDYAFYYDAARKALDWTSDEISSENRDWLRTLPFTYRIGPIGFCHGSPLDPKAYEYVFALDQAKELVPYLSLFSEITFIGHSHLCKAFAMNANAVKEVSAVRFGLKKGFKYIVSVGSVGQPRDYDNRACFTLYDANRRTVEYVRVEYDIRRSAQRILDAKLSPNFAKRLFLGV